MLFLLLFHKITRLVENVATPTPHHSNHKMVRKFRCSFSSLLKSQSGSNDQCFHFPSQQFKGVTMLLIRMEEVWQSTSAPQLFFQKLLEGENGFLTQIIRN